MSRTDQRPDGPPTDDRTGPTDADTERGDAEQRIRQLEAENKRLREEYVRTQQSRNRLTAGALLGVGLIGLAIGILFPAERTVFFALGTTGVFGAILTYFLSPQKVVPAAVGRSMYDTISDTGSAIRDELGLTAESVYCPVESTDSDRHAPVRLFVPQSTDYEIPSDEDFRSTFVAPDDHRRRGVALTPSAGRLLTEFERAASSVSGQPETLATQLCDALVEQFELARSAEVELDVEGQRVTVRVEGCAYPSVSGFDHPVPSLIGCGFAHGLGEPVTVETEPADSDAASLVTCRW